MDPETCCKYPLLKVGSQIKEKCIETCEKEENRENQCCSSTCLALELGIFVNGTFFPEKVIELYSETDQKDVLSVEWKEAISKSMSKCESFCKLHNNFRSI